MVITDIFKRYINRRTDELLEDLIDMVSDLTSSIEDMNERQLSLEKTVKDTLKPKRIIRDGKIEIG